MRIGIENCPHRLNNLAYSPRMWKIIFDEVPHKSLGLEYDPSHPFWQGIDYIKAIYEFEAFEKYCLVKKRWREVWQEQV